ncbi:hypothetical protein J6590_017177 [Homalodisca vitripennis]|nr:hypothetical protein J6590_017177 [Homalodisca vitripennis]
MELVTFSVIAKNRNVYLLDFNPTALRSPTNPVGRGAARRFSEGGGAAASTPRGGRGRLASWLYFNPGSEKAAFANSQDRERARAYGLMRRRYIMTPTLAGDPWRMEP